MILEESIASLHRHWQQMIQYVVFRHNAEIDSDRVMVLDIELIISFEELQTLPQDPLLILSCLVGKTFINILQLQCSAGTTQLRHILVIS